MLPGALKSVLRDTAVPGISLSSLLAVLSGVQNLNINQVTFSSHQPLPNKLINQYAYSSFCISLLCVNTVKAN